MDPILITLIAIAITLMAYLIYYGNEINKYWLRRGIPFKKPLLFFGNSANVILMRKHFVDNQFDIIKEFPNEPVIGIYDLLKPIFLVKDVDIIEKILVKDFMHFIDRGFPFDKQNPFDVNLFTMSGKEWRAVRYKLSPMFTTTKLKTMYGTMADCSDYLTSILDKMDESQDVDLKEYIGCFAMDVIGSSAYGIDANNLSQPDNEFRKMGKKAFDFDKKQLLKMIIINCLPKIARLFKLSFNKPDVADYFCKIIRNTIEYRKQNGITRNDFLQMFMTLKEKGNIELHIKDPEDDYLETDTKLSVENFEFTDNMMIGNAFAFLNAGFEATAANILLNLYELSKNIDIQEKVRREIKKCVEEADGTLTYEALKKMTYLEQCVKETLRIYPPLPFLMRLCTKEYTFPNGYKMGVGETVFIPIVAIHRDPKIYQDPEEFRPERFNPGEKIPSCAFLPFGNGPRICIAMRFALLEIKHCIAKLLMYHQYKLSPNTKPFRFNKKSLFLTPADPILFNISKIK
ncbi:hypothetical protein O3M35_010183 [Rhynocoris fuscipes]|uniref:Cytochrome P450 n=1 Tax=Rhynocoris fuscipes TaxID=488301 RepID=A0AAW1D5P2_9HEMI